MTPTQRKAMEQALEALNDLRGYRQDIDDAIGALVEALAEQPALTATYTCGVCGVSMQMEQPAEQPAEPVAFLQFLTDVVTAAGLLSHGKTDKALAARINDFAVHLRTAPQPKAEQQEPVGEVTEAVDGAFKVEFSETLPVGTKLYTAPQPAIPPGYKLVPVEPTEAMCEEGLEDEGHTIRDGKAFADALYRAMLNAAPTPPAPAVEGETK